MILKELKFSQREEKVFDEKVNEDVNTLKT